jgi:hypothetical protein
MNKSQIAKDNVRRMQNKREQTAMRLEKPLTTPEEEARLADQAKSFPVTRLPYLGPSRENGWGETDEARLEHHAHQVKRTNETRKAPLLQRIRSIDVSDIGQ